MKTIEEKAKAYDKAIEKLRDFYRDYDTVSHLIDVKEELANLFPELKESEDEKIRKTLKHYLEVRRCQTRSDEEYINCNNFLTWLEKQGEQKPADKIKPKFKAGDWIVSSVLGTACIIDVNDSNEYLLEYINGKRKFSGIDYVNYEYDKWTIQDAKDGDVLANCNIICIYKNRESEHLIKVYLNYSLVEGVEVTDDTIGDFNLYPATKEQRDLLFQKMEEAEYEWDAERKELKKINKNTDVGHEYFSDLLEKDDCDNIDDYAYQCAYCMSHDWMKDTATWDDVERACKLGAEWNERHHNSSWSEEDAVNFNLVYTYVPDDSLRDWLKELKDRVQPQTTWKPSDDDINLLKEVEQALLGKDCHNRLVDFMWKLKKLKE